MKRNKNIFLSNRFFAALIAVVLLFVLAFMQAWIFPLAKLALLGTLALLIADTLLLFLSRGSISVTRLTGERLSLGDENPVTVNLHSNFPFVVIVELIDELPFQFQKRDFSVIRQLYSGESVDVVYLVRPFSRGEYQFGQSRVYVRTKLGFVSRGIAANNSVVLPVYPSFISMRKFELMAISDRLKEVGIKRIRKIGQHSEFDQIRDYVAGDDSRTINWKATARKRGLMVNQYQDECSQQVISLIDMGRVMEMPFNGMSLLDYAINASLVISNIAMLKHDRAGLITFSNKIHSQLAADRKAGHLKRIMDLLYNQETNFMESSYEVLYATVARKIKQRSLLVLYTNFEGLPSLKRQMPYLKKLAQQHLLLVVFFENTEIAQLIAERSRSSEEVYLHAIARKFIHDKKIICNELKRNGIQVLLTPPEGLSVNLINKYLEIKAREII